MPMCTRSKTEDQDEDEDYLFDPDQLTDRLPQPFRMIDKVVSALLDRTWEEISAREEHKTQKKLPVKQPTQEIEVPGSTNCLAYSEDGTYIFLGHAHGLSVIDTTSYTCEGLWKESDVEITSIQSTCLGGSVHLLSTVDDMGVSRLFVFHSQCIGLHLINVINKTDDINKRKVCLKFEVSRGGDYGAATMSCNSCIWMEVYRLPKEQWLKDHTSDTHSQSPPGLPGPTLLMKITAPKIQRVANPTNGFEIPQTKVRGGQRACLGTGSPDLQPPMRGGGCYVPQHVPKAPGHQSREGKQYRDTYRLCTSHFLFEVPQVDEWKPPEGVPVAVCVWWSGGHNLLQYPLFTTSKDKDKSSLVKHAEAEAQADMVWSSADVIVCSAVSHNSRYLAVGLTSGFITVWDRHTGLLCATVPLPVDGALRTMCFMVLSPPMAPQDPLLPRAHLLVSSESGESHLITVEQEAVTHTERLVKKPSDSDGLITVIEPASFQRSQVLLMQKSGSVVLLDVLRREAVCSLALPHTHTLASPWDPVFVFISVLHKLCIRGDKKTSYLLPGREKDSSVFIFELPETSVKETLTDRNEETQAKTPCSSLERNCDRDIQARLPSSEDSVRQRTHC